MPYSGWKSGPFSKSPFSKEIDGMAAWLTLVGIGEDGLEGLGLKARAALQSAKVIFGGARHLAMLPAEIPAERRPWPTPFAAAFDQVLKLQGSPVCILASGDPMFFGMGASLSRQLSSDEMHVLPAPSSFSLAAARMGWALQDVVPLTIHGRPIEGLNSHLHDGARLLILSHDGTSPAAISALLTARGFGPSGVTALEHMGGAKERRIDGVAADMDWRGDRSTQPRRRRLPRRCRCKTALDPGRPAGRRLSDRWPAHQARCPRRDAGAPWSVSR